MSPARTALLTPLVLLAVGPGRGAARAESRGEALARLRAEVDELETRLRRVRSDARSERLSLQTQRGDLDVLLRKEEVRGHTLARLRAQQLARRREVASRSARLAEPARAAADRLREHVRRTLPFHGPERLAAIDDLVAELARPGGDPAEVLSRLWQAAEDELKLASECALHRQVIELDGERQLVEVARLGMAALYFRTTEGRVGWAVPRGDGHLFELLVLPERVRAVEALFEALRKQVRKGRFDLPLPGAPHRSEP